MMKCKKAKSKFLNKKGIFYSLSVVLFLAFLIILFNSRAQAEKKDERFYLERAQVIVMDRFARDFDNYYAQNILEAAAKPALIALSGQVPFAIFKREQIVALMHDGSSAGAIINPLLTTKEGFRQSLGTLSFTMSNNEFDYSLEKVQQTDFETLLLNFKVNYSFTSFGTTWSANNKALNITLQVYGLAHPVYGKVIDSSWIENNTASCFVNQIISDAAPCTGMNIMPKPICGNGMLEGAEECDDSNLMAGDGCDEHCQIEVSTP